MVADEQKLIRAMQPIARRLFETYRVSGRPLDPRVLTDETVRQFERAVLLGPHNLAIRERLEGWFRRLIANPSHPPAEP